MKYFGVSPEKNLLSGTLESRTLLAASAGADAGVMYIFPLLDARVLDFALTVPRRLYIDGNTKRVLPQRALSDILPDYLTLVLNSPIVQLQAERDTNGAIIQHWKPSEIEKVVIPVLDMDKQIEISDKVEESFALRKKSKKLLEDAKRAVEIAIEQDEESAIEWLKDRKKEAGV